MEYHTVSRIFKQIAQIRQFGAGKGGFGGQASMWLELKRLVLEKRNQPSVVICRGR